MSTNLKKQLLTAAERELNEDRMAKAIRKIKGGSMPEGLGPSPEEMGVDQSGRVESPTGKEKEFTEGDRNYLYEKNMGDNPHLIETVDALSSVGRLTEEMAKSWEGYDQRNLTRYKELIKKEAGPTDAAKILAGEGDSRGALAFLERTKLPMSEKREILAQAYDSSAKESEANARRFKEKGDKNQSVMYERYAIDDRVTAGELRSNIKK